MKNNLLLLVVEIGPSSLRRSCSISRGKTLLNRCHNIALEKFKSDCAVCFKHSACVTCHVLDLPAIKTVCMATNRRLPQL